LNKIKTFSIAFLLTICFTLFSADLSQAQTVNARSAQERLTENLQLRERARYLEASEKEGSIIAKARNFLFSFGGWADLDYIEYHDDDNNDGEKDIFDADLLVDTRLWVKGTVRHGLWGNSNINFEHTVFAQLRNLYISRWPNEEQPLARDDNDGPHMDLLYIDLDLHKAALRTGRQYLNLGRGITLADIYDGVQLTANASDLQVEVFAATTLPHEENIDYSVPGFDKTSERYFFGTETVWFAKENFKLYGYFLMQHDDSKPNPDTSQDFSYHSQYWGAGGSYRSGRGYYLWGEYILETGSSAVYGEENRHNILAHAFDLGAGYRIPCSLSPNLDIEYAFASGDRDRSSVTNTEGGNQNGEDHNFLPYLK